MTKEIYPLSEMSLRQLRALASTCGIKHYSRMRKVQLLVEIEAKQRCQDILIQPQTLEAQEAVEAAKFNIGQQYLTGGELATVDAGFGDLPSGYGESRVVLMPRDSEWVYTYWDIPNEHKNSLRSQGGQFLALRLYDVTDISLDGQAARSVQEYACDELAREWYLPIPVSDRDYVLEIGYRCADGRWLRLVRSAPTRVPPVYPSDWINDQFMTVRWDQDLIGKTLFDLGSPLCGRVPANRSEESIVVQPVPGSLFGSMQMVSEQAISSFTFPSGMGSGMSGVGMSGIGFFASMPPLRPRKFWLVADAELIVYGATEPDAMVTIGGRPIQLNADGTFRFQMSFQDGLIDYPIMAVAADGEQNRAIHIKFTRETLERRTNAREEVQEELIIPNREWPSRFQVRSTTPEWLKDFKAQVLQTAQELEAGVEALREVIAPSFDNPEFVYALSQYVWGNKEKLSVLLQQIAHLPNQEVAQYYLDVALKVSPPQDAFESVEIVTQVLLSEDILGLTSLPKHSPYDSDVIGVIAYLIPGGEDEYGWGWPPRKPKWPPGR